MKKPVSRKEWFSHVSVCGIFSGKACDMDCEKVENTNMIMGEIVDHD